VKGVLETILWIVSALNERSPGGRSTALLEPLASHIGKLVRAGPALFADDTPVKMQTRGKTGKAQTARLWSYVRDERRANGTPMVRETLASGAGRRRPVRGISSAWIGRGSIRSAICLATKGSCMAPLGSILRMRLSRCLAGHVYMPEKGAMDGHTGFNHRPATHALHV